MTEDVALRLADRLMRYCAVDTQSDAASDSQPSTAIQLNLARLLAQELREIGATAVRITEYGAVLAEIPATDIKAPAIGFCAHMDTAPAFAAEGVKPRLHAAWDGAAITFPDDATLRLSPGDRPYLATKIGDDIVTASGATLLGADDKAGIAIIMTLAQTLLGAPEIRYGGIKIAFTPDEEIGRGVDPRLPDDMGADFAYTVDGGVLGEIVFESFSADAADIRIEGVSAHTGYAKGILVNALHVASEIVTALNVPGETPATTDGREGFVHCEEISGRAARAELKLILRDFDKQALARRGDALRETCAKVEARHPGSRISCEITKQYRNMRDWLEHDMTPVTLAQEACVAEGIKVISAPIRGGTDGSQLTERGLPCPNIFTGMQDIHGPLEWISVQDMAAALRVCLRIVQTAATGARHQSGAAAG